MKIPLTNLDLQGAAGDPLSSLSRDSCENGVSSRVEACRKRLRMIRANQKAPIETVDPTGMSIDCNLKAGTDVSRSQSVIEARSERLDEAGIT